MSRLGLNSTAACAAAVLMFAAVGCDEGGEAGVFGHALTDETDLSRLGTTVNLRAVPDHINGFSPDQPYTGDRVFSATCPLEHTEFPLEYAMFGRAEDLHNAPPRWVVLAWIGDDENETWVRPGQLYGTQTFEFGQNSYSEEWADEVIVVLDKIFEAP